MLEAARLLMKLYQVEMSELHMTRTIFSGNLNTETMIKPLLYMEDYEEAYYYHVLSDCHRDYHTCQRIGYT